MRNREGISGEDLASATWDQFRQGSAVAFERIYNEHAQALITYGLRVLNDGPVIRDAVQDLFTELWRSRQNLREVQHVKAYLFTALRYKLMRQGRLRTLYHADDILDNMSTTDCAADEALLLREQETQTILKVRGAVRTLSKRQQEAVTLKFYHGFSNEQIASIMGINYQSATNILHRAFLLLRRHFNLPALFLITLLAAG